MEISPEEYINRVLTLLADGPTKNHILITIISAYQPYQSIMHNGKIHSLTVIAQHKTILHQQS